jgi:activator of 2-hydroxyglutaryl-CoA dehydratase
LVTALGEMLNVSVRDLPHDPQIAGAVGAALIAMERLRAEA